MTSCDSCSYTYFSAISNFLKTMTVVFDFSATMKFCQMKLFVQSAEPSASTEKTEIFGVAPALALFEIQGKEVVVSRSLIGRALFLTGSDSLRGKWCCS